mgnify:FL=1
MEFDSNKPIYLQILDNICDQILDGTLKPDGRILSVREYGANLGVNPNTIMRSYEKLTNDGIIYNRRGLGYFISPDAREKVLDIKRKEFIDTVLPKIRRQMQLLGIGTEVFTE